MRAENRFETVRMSLVKKYAAHVTREKDAYAVPHAAGIAEGLWEGNQATA